MAHKLSTYFEDDFFNGAETVEIVFGIILAVGLGAALIAFQDTIKDCFSQAQGGIGNVFSQLLP